MNKWIEALKFDIIGQEGKNKLDKQERQVYTLTLSVLFFVLAILNMFMEYQFVWLVSICLFLIGARKMQIWLHKRSQLEE